MRRFCNLRASVPATKLTLTAAQQGSNPARGPSTARQTDSTAGVRPKERAVHFEAPRSGAECSAVFSLERLLRVTAHVAPARTTGSKQRHSADPPSTRDAIHHHGSVTTRATRHRGTPARGAATPQLASKSSERCSLGRAADNPMHRAASRVGTAAAKAPGRVKLAVIRRREPVSAAARPTVRNMASDATATAGSGVADRLLHAAAGAIAEADALIVTAGAGMGVDSGLPDFRSPEGFWRCASQLLRLGVVVVVDAQRAHRPRASLQAGYQSLAMP